MPPKKTEVDTFGLTVPNDDIRMDLLCSCKQKRAKFVYEKHNKARDIDKYIDWDELDDDEKIVWIKTAFPNIKTSKPKPVKKSLAELDN